MLYVVSGFMRTGTSMMMKALESGGLEACYNNSRDEYRKRFADEFYDPNEGGLYELDRSEYRKLNFPEDYEGKLIKGLKNCIPLMNPMPNGIRAVFMLRDKEEIRQSYNAFFNDELRNIENHEESMQRIINRIKNRKDIRSLNVFNYRDVVNNPIKYFTILKNNGWTIDVEKCSEIVNPKLYRFRKELLTISI